jgi:hypothetical protein
VDSNLFTARLILEVVQELNLPVITKAQNEAVSTVLQVLYFLQHGHVQFLVGDYKTRVLDAYGPDAFATRIKAKKLGKDVLPREVRDVNVPPPDEVIDMSRINDEEAVGSDDEGSESHLNRDGEGEQANTHVPSTPQQERRQRSTETPMPPKNSEVAGFGSDTSPRNETGDNDELSQAERK